MPIPPRSSTSAGGSATCAAHPPATWYRPTPDGQITTVHCAGVANILPGLHLVVGLPANLSLHDLVGTPQGSRATQPGRLRPREREILSLLHAGTR